MEMLTIKDRMLLIRFVCAFAWSDLELHPKERERVFSLMERLELSDEQQLEVIRWLQSPPAPEEVDPHAIPKDKRDLFLQECHAMIEADGELQADERESMVVLRRILGRN